MLTVSLADVVDALTSTGLASVIAVSALVYLVAFLYKRARS